MSDTNYTYKPYPKVVYNKTEGSRIVTDADAHAKLGAGWFESPADLNEPVKPTKPKPSGGK